MLEIKDLNFSYKKKSKLISDFTLKIEEGTICGLLGKNGTGKSTLLYLICGLLAPKSGKIEFDGFNPADHDSKFLSNVFLAAEEFNLPNITIKEYVEADSGFYPNFSYEQFLNYLGLFEMTEEMKLGKISMGQKKKAYLSFAMACNTPLLILDEPTNGLDISSKRNFRKALAECMTDNKIILISTHQVYDVDKILDHVVIMDNGGVLLNSSIAGICEKYKFSFTTDRERAQKALSSIEIPGGYNIVEPLTEESEETEVNLESLFEFITAKNHNHEKK